MIKSGPEVLDTNPFVVDFITFGRKKCKIAWILEEGLVTLCSVSYNLKKITSKSIIKVQLVEDRAEIASFLAVCDEGKYMVAGFQDDGNGQSSRLVTFKVKNCSLHLLHILDEYDHGITLKSSFEFLGGFGKNLVWLAASKSFVLTYWFDCESGEMRELVGKRVAGMGQFPVKFPKFHRIGEKSIYFTEETGKVMRLTVRI